MTATFVKESIRPIIAIMVIVCGFGTIWFLPNLKETYGNQIIMLMLTVLSFYFGNSQGNTKKDEIIVDQLSKESK